MHVLKWNKRLLKKLWLHFKYKHHQLQQDKFSQINWIDFLKVATYGTMPVRVSAFQKH